MPRRTKRTEAEIFYIIQWFSTFLFETLESLKKVILGESNEIFGEIINLYDENY